MGSRCVTEPLRCTGTSSQYNGCVPARAGVSPAKQPHSTHERNPFFSNFYFTTATTSSAARGARPSCELLGDVAVQAAVEQKLTLLVVTEVLAVGPSGWRATLRPGVGPRARGVWGRVGLARRLGSEAGSGQVFCLV